MEISHNETPRSGRPKTPLSPGYPPLNPSSTNPLSFSEITTYPYKPLSSTNHEIRLLKLYPGRTRHSPIKCSLIHTKLDRAPNYVALSYAWGERRGGKAVDITKEWTAREVIVDRESQGVIGVTANLKSALLMLRGTLQAPSEKEVSDGDEALDEEDDRNEGDDDKLSRHTLRWRRKNDEEKSYYDNRSATPEPFLLWVDAICINQSDISERSIQTSNMREIYQRAESVAVWLGERDRGSAEAFQVVRDFNLAATASAHLAPLSPTVRDIILNESRKEHLSALVMLFRRHYWWRIWVIQEVSVARSTMVYCGNDSISWSDLDNVCTILQNEELALRTVYYQHPSYIRTLTHGGPRGLQLSRYSPSGMAPPLHELLLTHKSKDSTDPKDKVYALVGISSSRHTFGPIDYSHSIFALYTHTARHIITATRRIDIICVKQHDKDNFNLPSWVPDWTRRPPHAGHTVVGLHHHDPPFAAAGEREAEAEFLGDNLEILKVKGVVLDVITGTRRPFKRRGKPSEIKPALKVLRYWWRVFMEERGQDDEAWKVFGRIVSCGFWDWEEREFVRRLEGVWKLADRMLPILEGVHRAPTGFSDLGRSSTGFSDVSRTSTGLSEEDPGEAEVDGQDLTASTISTSLLVVEFDEEKEQMATILSAGLTMNRRRLFSSRDGLVGLAPWNAEEGDVIVLLFGCRSPVVLRRKEGDGWYLMIGEAYVEGCMGGEVMHEVEKGALPVEEFEIR